MKIALFDPYLDTMSGGEKYMLSIAQALKREHTITILWESGSTKDILSSAKSRFGYDLSVFSFAKPYFGKGTSLLQRFELSKEYDLLILLSDGSIPVVACPLILHFQSPMTWVKGRSLKNQLKLTRVKKIIVNSEYTKSYIDQTFGKNSLVLYPPVKIKRKYDSSKKKKKILNVGRFGINQAGSSYKKQDVLADTFAKIYKRLPGWELVFVMSLMEKDREVFEDFKKKYDPFPIKFLVNPGDEVLWDEYEEAQIYWHASGFGEDLTMFPDRAEHFGISTVEAMGMGAVPIVFAAGGQKEIVSDRKNGRLWSSTAQLEEYTLDVVGNSKIRKDLINQGVIDADKYSFERFSRQIEELVK